MRAIPRSDWTEVCESVNRRVHGLHAMVDAEVEHRAVSSVDYAPFDDVVEIVLTTPAGNLRILVDQPDELLASDSSDPYFALVVVSNGSSIVLRDAIALESGHENATESPRVR